jgi:hypothetical protein
MKVGIPDGPSYATDDIDGDVSADIFSTAGFNLQSSGTSMAEGLPNFLRRNLCSTSSSPSSTLTKLPFHGQATVMELSSRATWEQPQFSELSMNAEIGSYQDDFDGNESPIVEPVRGVLAQ